MPKFLWKGRNRYGDLVTGERISRTKEELNKALQREQIVVTSITRKTQGIHIPALERKKVKLKELALYSRQLAVLIDAELPLIQGLNILSEQTKNKYFKKVIQTIRGDVEAGSTLNQAKRKFPRVFDDLYCNLVASGEQSGSLDIMLKRLADYQENIVKLRSKVKQALIYPSAIMGFAILVMIFLMWKVIPVFATIYGQLGAKLPGLTAVILSISAFVEKNIVFIFGGLFALIIALRFIKKSEAGGRVFDIISMKIPLFGVLLEKVGLSRVTRTLSTLLSGGVPMLESLKITSSTSGNVIMEEHIIKARTLISEGTSLTDAFREAGKFPFMLIQMIGVGEATGTLDSMLSKLADFYDQEVEAMVNSLLSILEPILLIVVGGMVGMMIISMYLPMFNLLGEIG